MNLAAKMWYVQYVRWKKKEVIVKNKKQNKKKNQQKKKENPWCTGMAS